jgi:N-carbamoylputrescine amidase
VSKIKLATIQQKYHANKADTIKYTIKEIEKVAKNGANLVLLQELHTGHYFCQSANEDNFELAEYFEDEKKIFSKVAKDNGIVLVTSLFEKRAVGIYHNTAVVFDTDGSECGFYRKMHIPDDPGFYEKFYFTPSSDGFNPIKTSLGNLGVLICWDQWYPEAARIMSMKGADILIYPTAIGWFDEDTEDEKQRQLDAWITIQRSHAVANGIPVVAINRVGFEKDDSGVLDGIRFWGNSFVAGPQGEILYQASSDKQESNIIEIDLIKSKDVRKIWPFFRDRRIEFFEDLTKRYLD